MSEKIRVLIVDDIAETRENIRRLLQFETDIEVIATAESGKEGVKLAQELFPDVVIMDSDLPDMDGVKATEIIRSKKPETQVIILSVRSDSNIMRQALLAGARDFQSKPPLVYELIDSVWRSGVVAHNERTKNELPPKKEKIETQSFIADNGRKIRVLIVDDIEETENLRRLLKFEPDIDIVGVAGGGREGVQLALDLLPNVVLMDLHMPDMDGMTATESIKKVEPHIEVIILSVQNDQNYRRRSMLVGARDFLIKPPKSEDLISAIKHAGKIAKSQQTRNSGLLKKDQQRIFPTNTKISKEDYLPKTYVFISYIKEDYAVIDQLQSDLEAHGIRTWRDRNNLYPGMRWKAAISRAIKEGALFLACFSQASEKRLRTYMNEELNLAIEELRLMPKGRMWFIPIKLNPCEIPNWNIGGGETLNDIQYLELFPDWEKSIATLIRAIKKASQKT